jgi:hypothetical protein
MYTGTVVKVRLFASPLAFLLAATPVLGVVCQMDCDQQAAAPACHHQSLAATEGPMLRSTHLCDHDHSGGSPALQAGTPARESSGTLVGISVPPVRPAAVADARLNVASTHGPPGSSSLSTSSLATVLRI